MPSRSSSISRCGDLVAILRTSAGMGAFQQFTTDRALLHAAIDRIRFSFFSRVGTSNPVDLNGLMRVGTLGARRYAVDGLREFPGRKSVVLFSENMPLLGVDSSADCSKILFLGDGNGTVRLYREDWLQ
jgi:hypothetical protein